MSFRVENLGMLLGLLALAVPIILHFLQRRRFDTLDWAAMQFLPDSVSIQRRRWLDEILLMLMRMGVIALIVLALAMPTSTGAWFTSFGERPTRDIVLILDGSYSMDARIGARESPWQEAIRVAHEQVESAAPGDRFAILIARQPPVWQLAEFSGDLDEVRAALNAALPPRGNPDMPRALAQAWQHLQDRTDAAAKQIVVFSDQQQHGWSDPATLSALDEVGSRWHADRERARSDGLMIPSLRIVKVGGDLPASLPSNALAPLVPLRRLAKPGQSISFESALHIEHAQPGRVKVLVDGTQTQSLPLPDASELKKGQIPLRFQHRFDKVGQYVVTVIVEPDRAHDVLAADNEQHAVIDVVTDLPILIVDGDRELSAESSSFFLQRALSSKDAGRVGAIPYSALTSRSLFPEGVDAVKPAVLVLADVPRLAPEQHQAIERFLAEGGGLWVIAGERAARAEAFYNELPWIPARLAGIATLKDGAQPDARKFQHPALELFRASPDGSMKQVRFTSWHKVQLVGKEPAAVIASFAAGDPFLLEKPYKRGRVILSTVPMDRRWGSTLPSTWEFPVLAHELAYYLAGNSNGASILEMGEPIRLAHADAKKVRVQTPESPMRSIPLKGQFDNTGAIGVYRLDFDGKHRAFVVPPDLRESGLTRCSPDDWRRVRDRLPIAWSEESSSPSVADDDARREELWWLLLLAVIGLLCGEVWMTRRMARARGGVA